MVFFISINDLSKTSVEPVKYRGRLIVAQHASAVTLGSISLSALYFFVFSYLQFELSYPYISVVNYVAVG